MLIVSQNKEKVTDSIDLYICKSGENFYLMEANRGSFGTYESRERAKEVLQEIIKAYTDFNYLKFFPTNITKSVEQFMHKKYSYFDVYEMPKE